MKQISRLSSGRVSVKSPADVASDRYQLLDLASAEPNLGTAANGSVLVTDTVGSRTWTQDLTVSNVNVSSNLTAGRVYTDHLLFANGNPYIAESTASNIYNGNITVGTSVTLIDTVAATGVSSVKWVVTAKDTVNGTLKSSTIDSVNNGTDTYYNEYGVVLSNNSYEVAVFTSSIVSGNVNLYALGESAQVTITFQRTTLGTGTVPGYVPGAGYIQNVVGSGTATNCVVNSFTGTGSQTNYTLSATPADENQVIAVVGGIVQPKSVYTVSGAVLTFDAAPASGVSVEITTFVTTTVTGYTGSAGATGSTGSRGYTGSAGSFTGTVSGNLTVSGTTFVTGDILPTSNNTVNIGSATQRFGTLYLAANTIDLGGTTISTSPTGALSFATSSGTVDITANTVNFLSTVATTAIAPGESGPIGYTGSRGAQGTTGYTGSAGTNGTNGTNGYTGSAGAAATVPKITAIAYNGDDTATNIAGGDTITLTGTGFASGAIVIVNSVQASVATVVSSTTMTFTAPANPTGTYVVYVVNTDGGTALAVPGLQYSGTPTWTTAAGTLGTYPKLISANVTVTATGDAPITYSVYSGTLPSGLTLNANTGVISGTTPSVVSSTTYSFTVRSTDAQKQDTDRVFSITIVPVNPPTAVEMLLVAGGGAGGKDYGGGGGAGGLLYYGTNSTPKTPNGGTYSMTTGVTYAIVVGAGGATATNGGDSTFSAGATLVYSATGGGKGGTGYTASGSSTAGTAGGSGGGGGFVDNGGTGSGGSATSGQGNIGGNGRGQNYSGGLGGGGGAGTQGSNGSATAGPGGAGIGGAGGNGLSYDISGSATTYAGGGGGNGFGSAGSSNGAGGSGGGGSGATAGSPGTSNTGGGGGGANNGTNGTGGSGVVILRYSNTFSEASTTTGSPTYTNTGGYHIYKWTSSGSITF